MAAPYDPKTRERFAKVGAIYEKLVEDHDWENNNPTPVNMSTIRSFLEQKIPFYTEALQKIDVRFVEKKETPSMAWTDGFRIYISVTHYELFGKAVVQAGVPWFASRDLGMVFLVLHELGHIVLKSFERRYDRDPRLWNTATDEKINQLTTQMMREAGMFKTTKAYENFIEALSSMFILDPSKYGEHTAEEVFGDLHELHAGLGGGEGGGAANGGDMVGDGTPDKDENGNELSNEEKMARDIVKDAMKDYQQRNASKLPGRGSCGRELDYVMADPPVRMSAVLKQIPRTVFKTDYGYGTRPSRIDHMLPIGPRGEVYRAPIELPLHPDKIQCALAIVDMSGSMGNKELNDTINMIRDAQKYLQRIYLICHTDRVEFSDFIDNLSDVPTNISGGTAFGPVLEHVAELEKYGKDGKRFKFAGSFWITDCYGEPIHVHDFKGDLLKKMRFIVFGNTTMGSFDIPNPKVWYVDEIS